MEVNDVRVGNWVRGSAQMKIYQVTKVHIADLITIQNNEEELECLSDRVYPIELTDDLLVKIGFKYKNGCFKKLVLKFIKRWANITHTIFGEALSSVEKLMVCITYRTFFTY